ncbi:MAG: HAD family hydrolase [Clostridia bacterium]|nr:HAD family hydrolase [Clostridia bacterium]
MIKLIATDMDGTLLTTDKRMPEDILSVVRRLKEKGAAFVIASGRQYASLRRDLMAMIGDVIFIAENGALIVENDERLFIDPLPADTLKDILIAARGLQGVHAVVCCADCALVSADAPASFIRDVRMYYQSARTVPDLIAACEGLEDVCKIAFCSMGNAATNALPPLENALGDRLAVILSGQDWVDVMKKGVHKGSAMRMLQSLRGVSPEECMAFGDYLNDYELLESVTESYAMENALPALKRIAKHIAPSNDDNGVMRVIKARFDL